MSKEKLIPDLRFPEFKNEGEWEENTLGEVAEVYQPRTISQSELKSSGYLVYGANGIIGFYDQFNHETNQIAIACRGSSCGTVNFTEPKSWITGNAMVVNVDGFNNIDKRFMYFLLSYSNLDYLVSGSGQPQITGNIKSHKVQLPKKAEQQKIASCLSSLDEVIATHSQKLELLKDHKKGLMQNLFPQIGEKVPKYRFKEFEKDGEWEEKKLGDLIELKGRIGYRGYTLEDIVGKGEGAISMSPSNINEFGTLSFVKSTYITWAKYDESPEIMLENGFTVLVKTGSTYGKVAFIKNLTEKTTINPQLVVLKPKKVNNYFLYLLVANESIQKQINAKVVGGAIPTLSQESISNFEILVPKIKEQEKIAECLSSLNDLIISQTERIEQLKLHKKGLMQGLFPKFQD